MDFDYRVASLSSHDSISGEVSFFLLRRRRRRRGSDEIWEWNKKRTCGIVGQWHGSDDEDVGSKKKEKKTLFSEWGAKSCGGGLGDYRRWKHVSAQAGLLNT